LKALIERIPSMPDITPPTTQTQKTDKKRVNPMGLPTPVGPSRCSTIIREQEE
jgi:hypothetical protein